MAFKGPLKEYSNIITKNIDDYYTKNKYIEFKPDPTMIMNNTLPSIANRSKFKLMTKTKEYDTVTPVIMSLFDKNLYNIDTATYNVSLYFSKMKKQEQELIRSGATILNETEGIKYIFKPGYLLSVEDFLKSRYSSSTTKTESFVSGLSGSDYNDNDNISIKNGELKINEDDKNLSLIDMFTNNFKNDIWNNYHNTNTIKEGMSDGLTYNVYDGYNDAPVVNSIAYFKNKPIKTDASGKPITGVTNKFWSSLDVTEGKINGQTERYINTVLYGYLFTKENGTGTWSFEILSDDMSILSLNDTYDNNKELLKIDNTGIHGLYGKSGTVNLVGNRYYRINMVQGNNDGPGDLYFRFKPPNSVNWYNNNDDKYFTTTIPTSTFKPVDANLTITSTDNSSVLKNLYETAKNAALSSVSSFKANIITSKPFVIVNPEVPNESITVFPPLMSGDKQRTKNGEFNSLDWNKINPISELSAEWFGYFKANISGMYIIQTNTNRPSINFCWIGENALVNYTFQNADISNCGPLDSTGMFTKGQNDKETIAMKIIAGRYYPVRFQYSQIHSPPILYNFNVYIHKINSDGSRVRVNNSTAYFCTLTDSNNANYEPIQMAMSLRNDKNETNPVLFNCYVSPIKISNNYTNNENLRKVKCQDSKIINSFNLTPKDTSQNNSSKLTLTSNGDLVFNNGINSRSITGTTLDNETGTIKNPNCDNMCSLSEYNTRNNLTTPGVPVVTDVNLSNFSVKENYDGSGEELLGKFVVLNQTQKTVNGLTYTNVELSVNRANYEAYYDGINRGLNTITQKKDTLDTCYVFYKIGGVSKPAVSFNYNPDTKQYTININNLAEVTAQSLSAQTSRTNSYDTYKQNYQTAINTDAQNCINKLNTDCNFYSGITNDGEITISNGLGKLIWGSKQPGKLISNLGASYSSVIPETSSLKSVSEWLTDAAKLKNYYIYSASYANPHVTTPFKSTSIGKGQTYEVLYSPNGKYKLTLERGTLELKYAINGDTYNKLYTNNDGSQSFMLYLISADEKIGNVYLANSEFKTMYEMKNDKTKILKYANTFSGSSVSANYQYPPYDPNSTEINSVSYTKTNQSKTACEKSCADSDSCTHYYSYTTQDGNSWCMTNTDKSPEQYYNKIPELKSSNLYIRDRMIDSTCGYSDDMCNKYKNVSLLTNSKNNTDDTFNSFNKDYDIIYTNTLHKGQAEEPSTEGVCGDPAIYASLANLVGPEEKIGKYKFNNMSCSKEGFSSLLPSDITKVTEGFNVTGYIESNACKLLDEQNNSINVNPKTYSSLLQNCKTDLLKNVSAIEKYWTEFNKNNTNIDNYYKYITSEAIEVNKKDAIINNASITPKTVNYDSIDFSGNLLLTDTLKNSTSLKDGRIKDERENITQETTMYLISIMALIAIFIFLIFVTSFE